MNSLQRLKGLFSLFLIKTVPVQSNNEPALFKIVTHFNSGSEGRTKNDLMNIYNDDNDEDEVAIKKNAS